MCNPPYQVEYDGYDGCERIELPVAFLSSPFNSEAPLTVDEHRDQRVEAGKHATAIHPYRYNMKPKCFLPFPLPFHIHEVALTK